MSFEDAYSFMEANEDRSQAHALVPDLPPGAHAISGINSAAYPTEFAAIAALPQDQRGPAVEEFYKVHFWNSFEDQLSVPLQQRVLDAAVNMGPGTAVRILQQAINSLGGSVTVDGGWGPATVAAANLCDQTRLLDAFRQTRLQHYKNIVLANPGNEAFVKLLGTADKPGQWWVRATE